MRARTFWLLVASIELLAACEPPPREDRSRRRSTQAGPQTGAIRPEVQTAFEAPPNWETVRLSRGIEYHQPPGFGLGLSDATLTDCDTTTTAANVPMFDATISDRWPLTLALRRGDLNRMARANGFVLDSVKIATQGQPPGDSTRLLRGEGWMLVSGRTLSRGSSLPVLFGTVRYPGGCYLVMAARGVDISLDTLGLVLSTIRYNR